MSLFDGTYRNPVHDMLGDALNIQLPGPVADAVDAIHEAEEAQRAQDRRAESCGLTIGEIENHLTDLTTLSADVEGHEYDSLKLIAEAIDRARDDLQELLEETRP